MNSIPTYVPVIPESAPFTPEQRAYLNGYLAGLFSFAPVGSAGAAPVAAAKALRPLTVVFGSQTGTAEKLARRIAKEAGQRGFAATIHDLASYPLTALPTEQNLLVITSTYGDGEPPDNAQAFANAIKADSAPRLENVRFTVCGLGDTNYARFCGFAREVDVRLEQLGAARVLPRAECDVEYEVTFSTWLAKALGAFGDSATASATASVPASQRSEPAEAGYSKKNPFPARMLTNRDRKSVV